MKFTYHFLPFRASTQLNTSFSEQEITQKVSATEQEVVKHERMPCLCLAAREAERREMIKTNQVSKEGTY